jgi:uroporphyrinogen decarboxylase
MMKVRSYSKDLNFDELIMVLNGKKNPGRVHNVEVIIDEEVKKILVEDLFHEQYFPLVGMDLSKNNKISFWNNDIDFQKSKENYYKMYSKLYQMLGYSVIFDHDFIINMDCLNDVFEKTKDTAELNRGQRAWAQEGFGIIRNWHDYEAFPWGKVEEMLEDYGKHLDFMKKILPDGMKIAVVGAMFYQVFTWLLGFEGLFYLINDDPGLLEAVMNSVAGFTLRMYEIAADSDSVGVLLHGDDLGFKNATMLSPAYLRKQVFPWYKKYSDIAHRNGKQFWVHCCGYKDEIMPDFIENIGVDALHSFEDACCPINEYKKKYGSKIGLIGGVDIDKLCRLDEVDLRTYIRDILQICMEGGRFAFGSGNSITNFVPLENFLIMLDEAEKWHSQ